MTYKVTYQVEGDIPIFINNVELIKENNTHYTFYAKKTNRKFTLSKDIIKSIIEVK
jgi:hypothetical protein